ncbi:cytochrome P450, partial [Streptomyces mirabilis]
MRDPEHRQHLPYRVLLTREAAVAEPESWRAQGLPPGPYLDAGAWRVCEREQYASLRAFGQRYGPVFTVHAEGRPPRVYVAVPEVIEDIFVRHHRDLVGLGPSMFEPLVTSRSVAFLNGEPHRLARRVLAHALDTRDQDGRARAIARVVRRETGRLAAGEAVPLEVFANDVTRSVILAVLFGFLPATLHEDLLGVIDRAMGFLHERQTAAPEACPGRAAAASAAFTRTHRELDRVLLRETRRHRQYGPVGECVVDRLIGSSAGDGGLSDPDIAMHLKTLLVSGHETTSASLAWALFHLARHPGVLEALRQEIGTGEGGGEPPDWSRLPRLGAFVSEVLRHSSPVPNGGARKVVRPFDAQGVSFPPGTEVVPAIQLVHHREAAFPSAEVFDPQRFHQRGYRNSEYLPFGIGPRYCLGAALA